MRVVVIQGNTATIWIQQGNFTGRSTLNRLPSLFVRSSKRLNSQVAVKNSGRLLALVKPVQVFAHQNMLSGKSDFTAMSGIIKDE